MSASGITVIVEEPGWKKSGVALSRVKAATRLALSHPSFVPYAQRGGDAPKGRTGPSARSASFPKRNAGEEKSVALLLTNDARLHALNVQFRGKDSPTNVLSFPAGGADGFLGDIAIALGVTSRESAATGISLESHTLHLAVHGVLHLLGYDHAGSREARIMERLETDILDELGIPDPYAAAKR